MTKEKTFGIRLTLDQYMRLYSYANSKGVDAAQIIRDLIDELGSDEHEIRKKIEYHKFILAGLQKDLEIIDEKKKIKKMNENIKKVRESSGINIIEHGGM